MRRKCASYVYSHEASGVSDDDDYIGMAIVTVRNITS